MPYATLRVSVLLPTALISLAALLSYGFRVAREILNSVRFCAAPYVVGMDIRPRFRGRPSIALPAGAFGLAITGTLGAAYGLIQTANPGFRAICSLRAVQGGCTINYL
ncbi:MAG: hypothetical protein OXM02_15280 [Bacteroidota bacterium]|nr:hypothetical protein [Bacteroidota bacterium]MDE2835861.1 hypothetical protein [Bacteroidota bacterium]